MNSASKDRANSTAGDSLSHSLREAMAMQEIEGNPFDEADIALFEMFERENWPHERRLAYIRDLARKAATNLEPHR